MTIRLNPRGYKPTKKERIAELEEQSKEEQEFPKHGDKYHYIEATGRIDWFQWDESGFGLRAQDIGNIYKTDEEAQFAVEKLKVEAELRKFSRPFKPWFNNYVVTFASRGELEIKNVTFTNHQGAIHFESKFKAQRVIDSIGEERIKKYIFGVED